MFSKRIINFLKIHPTINISSKFIPQSIFPTNDCSLGAKRQGMGVSAAPCKMNIISMSSVKGILNNVDS